MSNAVAEVKQIMQLAQKLPVHMHGGLERYLLYGILPGSFMEAVMSNELAAAYGRADEENTRAMREWAAFLYNAAPIIGKYSSWGSRERVMEWVEVGGLAGILDQEPGSEAVP